MTRWGWRDVASTRTRTRRHGQKTRLSPPVRRGHVRPVSAAANLKCSPGAVALLLSPHTTASPTHRLRASTHRLPPLRASLQPAARVPRRLQPAETNALQPATRNLQPVPTPNLLASTTTARSALDSPSHTMAPASFASAAAGNNANSARAEASGDW